jgi:hypothetical protein
MLNGDSGTSTLEVHTATTVVISMVRLKSVNVWWSTLA